MRKHNSNRQAMELAYFVFSLTFIFICKSEEVSTNNGNCTISKEKLELTKRSSCREPLKKLGDAQDKVEGGTNGSFEQLKFNAWIDISSTDGFELCSGVLIDSCHVLTHAPCVASIGGSTNITVILRDPKPARNVSHIKFYPGDGPQQNNIALLTLEECVSVPTTLADVICLPVHNADLTIQTATILSWDVSFGNNSPGPRDRQIKFEIKDKFEDSRVNVTCASKEKTCAIMGNATACLGDSGGPLFISSTVVERYLLIGISQQIHKSSFLSECDPADTTGMILTNVAPYQEWIEKERLCN